MKAIVCTAYGPPEVLRLEEVPIPTPQQNELLIKVRATTVATSGAFMRRGEPFVARFFTGLRRPKARIPGTDLAGEVVEVGANVTRFKKGDRIVAATDAAFGAHAQYACLPEDATITTMPVHMDFDEAASLCEGALTALPFLRDHAGIGAGTTVLVNGASGAIGTFAVQLAKHFEAQVTAVCSGSNAELARSLGADSVIDYTVKDFTGEGKSYDVIFDTVGKSSFGRCKNVLNENGVYLCPAMSLKLLLEMLWSSRFGRKKAVFAATGLRSADDKRKDLDFLKELAEAGKLRSVIDRRYPLEEAVEAARYVDVGHKKGNVVLTVTHEDDSA